MHEEDIESQTLLVKLKEAFMLIDKSCDGELTRAEIIRALRTHSEVRQLLGLERFRQGSAGHTAFEAKFQDMDCDNFRGVSWEEFAAAFDVDADGAARESTREQQQGVAMRQVIGCRC